MVECVHTESLLPFRVTARPAPLTSRPGARVAFALLAPWFGLAGGFFALLGAWPVAAFMAASLAGLLAAFHHLRRHADDFERITLDREHLVVDTHAPGDNRHAEFNSQWVSVAIAPAGHGGAQRLLLRAQGREFAFGRLLTADELADVGRELNRRLSRFQQWGIG